MIVAFTEAGWADYQYWLKTDLAVVQKINRLVDDSCRNLFCGLGKPEPLKGILSGWWSRRITGDHRLIHRIIGRPDADQRIEIAACRYHYED